MRVSVRRCQEEFSCELTTIPALSPTQGRPADGVAQHSHEPGCTSWRRASPRTGAAPWSGGPHCATEATRIRWSSFPSRRPKTWRNASATGSPGPTENSPQYSVTSTRNWSAVSSDEPEGVTRNRRTERSERRSASSHSISRPRFLQAPSSSIPRGGSPSPRVRTLSSGLTSAKGGGASMITKCHALLHVRRAPDRSAHDDDLDGPGDWHHAGPRQRPRDGAVRHHRQPRPSGWTVLGVDRAPVRPTPPTARRGHASSRRTSRGGGTRGARGPRRRAARASA